MRRSPGFLLALNTSRVGMTVMGYWVHVLLLPAVLLNYVPVDLKNSYLGLLTFIGLIVAMIVQPIAGAFSDRVIHRWGRRVPLIIIGTLLDLFFLGMIGWGKSLVVLAAGYIGLQFTSNISQGAQQGLLPDEVPADQLGLASGLKSALDITGIIGASLVVARLIDPNGADPRLAIMAVIGTLLITTLVTVFTAAKGVDRVVPIRTVPIPWKEVFRVDIRGNKPYWWLLASRFFFLLGVYGLQSFAQYFIRDRLNVDNPIQVTGDLMASIAISLLLFTLLSGWLSDRIGRRRMQIIAGGFGIVGTLLMMNAQSDLELSIYGLILGLGLGTFMAANWALVNEYAPPAEAGKFLGLTNLATAGASALGRLEGPAIDALNLLKPGAFYGWTAMFIFGAVCILASTILLWRMPAYLKSRPSIFTPGHSG